MNLTKVRLSVNGRDYERDVEPRMLLSDFLREELELKGTHVGCEHGTCGVCTVLMDGKSARSCLTLAVQANGTRIETVESLGTYEKPHLLQESFREKHGLQCGFCTPSMLMVSKELLDRNPNPSVEDIRESISSNLCRCTGYQTIVEAVQTTVQKMKEAKHDGI